MKTLKIKKFLAVGFMVAVFALASTVSYAQTDTKKDVNVVNTPSVEVVNTPKVLNGNDSNIFQDLRFKDTNFNADTVTFTVPAGKRLVIEFASIRTNVGAGEQVQAFIRGGSGFSDVVHPIVMTFQQRLAGQDNYVGSQLMGMYAEPGTTVELLVSQVNGGAGPTPGARIEGSISGYLVHVP